MIFIAHCSKSSFFVSNQKMLHEKVVKEREKMSHTKFGTILVPFGTTSPIATKIGI